ncbi:MAG: AAA family ATPase [Gemmatimonadaceae bacterium]
MLRPSDSVLSRFTRDLTAEARSGALEPVRSRAEEIARVMDILLRHGKNNPVLVGPAGVGKTAIAEGLAQRIVAGGAPLSLRDVRILALDHVALLAGTTYRGQYEERIRGLVEETTAAPDVILFVDEMHNLIGQGTALGVAMDAANMLKPALVRGDFRVIGATTDGEYDQWIRGDPALERRFQRVPVRELGVDETMEILEARRHRLERHHAVVIADDAMRAAVELTDLHVTDRMRPDRALDALDEACAHTHATAEYSPRAELLIRARRDALRAAARAWERPRAASPSPSEPSIYGDDVDPFDRFARDSFAALERFGAELEAALVGQAPSPVAPGAAGVHGGPADTGPNDTAKDSEAGPGRRRGSQPASLPEIEQELAACLAAEGKVVRGHDIARVVSVATGRTVTWGRES